MTSRLSSLLVRDGVVGVKRMEKAFQRQVLFGGGLDTILLEMTELNEQRLLQYLSLATGLPPATARELEALDPRAAVRCPRELAERFHVVPLSFDGDALRILTHDPVDLSALEDLASELGTPVQPFVAPEFRFELAFDRVFGRSSEERFTRLAAASRLSAIPPMGRARSVVVEAAGAMPAPAAPAAREMEAEPEARPPEALAGASTSPDAQAPAAVEASPETAGAARGGVDVAPETAAAARGSVDVAPETAGAPLGGVEMAQETAAPEPGAVEMARETAAPEPAGLHAARETAAPEPAGLHAARETGAPGPAGLHAARETAVSTDLVNGSPTVSTARRGTVKMTAEAVRARRQETDRQAAEAYRRHAREDTEPGVTRLDMHAGPAEAAEAVGAVATEYDIPDSADLDLTPPMGLPPEYVMGDVPGRGDEIAPPLVPATAAPSGPLATEESAGTAAPGVRRMAGFDPTPLTVGEARALLAQAEHRDVVFEILLRAIRARAWYVSLLTVHGGAATGRVAMVGDEVDHSDIAQVVIPLDKPSAFRQAVNTASPYIGPVATGNSEIDRMIRHMGGVIPPSALLLPLVLRNRVVALLVGHRGGDMLRVTEASELLPLAASASDALGRIIRHGKAKGQQTAAVAPPTTGAADAEGAEEPRATDADAGAAAEVEALMLVVEGANEDAAAGALQEALARAADVKRWLHDHFPGRLKVDRFQVGGRRLRAGQHGPLLDLVVRMGEAAADLVIQKLRESPTDVRYYAALCALEMRLGAMRVPLVERLFDSDQGIRAVALEALSGYPADQLDDALDVARRALRGQDTATVEAAANALGALADVRAIPELIDMHGRGGMAANIAARALVRLTKQDFGTSNRKWRHWWDKNRRRSRIEWLLEGLGHKDPQVRRSAVEDLRRATGEYFGYHHDLPRREREQARQRWLDWWNQTGRLRFLPDGDKHGDRARPG